MPEIFLQETAAFTTKSNDMHYRTFQSHTGHFGYLAISRLLSLLLFTLCHLNLEVDSNLEVWY